MDCRLPGSSVRGILQARILEWVAIPFSDPGIKPGSPALQVDSYCQNHQGSPRALLIHINLGRSDLMRNEGNLKNNSLFTLKVMWKTKLAQEYCWRKSESHSVESDSLQPHGLYSLWNSPGQNTGMGSLLFSRGSSQTRDKTQVSCIADRFFTSWATGKPKNTGVGSLSFLQRIVLTQELNWGLLHCRRFFTN